MREQDGTVSLGAMAKKWIYFIPNTLLGGLSSMMTDVRGLVRYHTFRERSELLSMRI